MLGIEADGQALVGNRNNNNNFFNFGNNDDNTPFLGTVRGRAGIALTASSSMAQAVLPSVLVRGSTTSIRSCSASVRSSTTITTTITG